MRDEIPNGNGIKQPDFRAMAHWVMNDPTAGRGNGDKAVAIAPSQDTQPRKRCAAGEDDDRQPRRRPFGHLARLD